MTYGDGEAIEIGDQVEVNDNPEHFEAEEATVLKIGKGKLQVEYTNEYIKNRKVWVSPQHCELIARDR